MSVGGIIVATLLRDGFPDLQHWGNPLEWHADGWARVTADPTAREILLNVALFVPAGTLVSLWSRRPLLTWGGLALLSVLIEFLQALVGAGVADPSDLLANSVGAGLGCALAALMLGVESLARGRRPRWEVLSTVMVAMTLTAAAVVGVHHGARSRLADVERQVLERSLGLDRAEYLRLEGRDLEEHVWRLHDVRADGVTASGRMIIIRYPANYFFTQQCVLMQVTDQGTQVQAATNSRCSRVNP